ncbi:MAG: DUF1761 domain-containing protein [Gemmatimonadales bacterium]|nr:DUF1761 domain-containing protein [Gemmatimonadales bacterium]
MDFSTINHLAVITAAVASFILGGLWYGPICGSAWMKENGFSVESLQGANQGKIFGLSFLWTLIMAYNLALFLNTPTMTVGQAVMYGFFTGFGWIAMGVFVIGLFERRSAKLMLINGGFMTVSLTIMGAIIGGWR